MPRAQCIVTRGNRILMAKHSEGGQEVWCLPGGGIEPGETPEQAALRELTEECGVTGRIVRKTSVCADPACDVAAYTFHVEIGSQKPALGRDPEFGEGREQILKDIRWLSLAEISERDRAFLWTGGLIAVPGFWEEVERWGGDLSYPAPIHEPTSYADVNAVLASLTRRIREILGDNLVGLYLYGSLATGGFHRESSDIDFLAATFQSPNDSEEASLKAT